MQTAAIILVILNSSVTTPGADEVFAGCDMVGENPANLGNSLCRGWPVDLGTPGAGFPYTPLLIDIDDDGACEIFVTGGETFGIDGDGSFLPGWPVQEMAYMGYGSTGQLPGPSGGDLNGDGLIEIMWSTRDWYAGSAHLWSFNGRASDGTDLSGYPLTAPDQSSNALASPFVLGDSNGDGYMEAVSAHTLGNTGDYYRVSSLNYDGTFNYTIDLDTGEEILDVYFGDADGNGNNEFFLITLFSGDFRLHLLNPDGSHQPDYPVSIYTPGGGYLMFGPPIPADLDSDADLEIVLGYCASSTSYAMAVHHDGTPCPGFPLTIATGSQLFYLGMGDLNADGQPELLAVDNELSADYRLWAYDMDTGYALPGWPVYVSGWPKGFPIVADLDGDGAQEVSVATDDGLVHAYSAAGTELAGFPKTISTTSTSGTAVSDIDGDGFYELVCATWDGWVYAWDTDGPVADDNRDWPMRGRDVFNTGVYGNPGQSGVETGHSVASMTINANPVAAAAFFTVTGNAGTPSIGIYDLAGKLVEETSGVWTPGDTAPCGVYIAVLRGTQVEPVKFLLAR